jgi:Zn-dependent protease
MAWYPQVAGSGRGGDGSGRFGIDIRIDWSWVVIFLLVTWNLWAAFGNCHSDWGFVLRWGVAISAALLFFASVLVHELAHSLIAKAQGTSVQSIVLHLFGGVSNIQREPDSPSNEFLIAIVQGLSAVLSSGGFSSGRR